LERLSAAAWAAPFIFSLLLLCFLPGAVAAAIAAAKTPALVVLRGKNEVAFGGIINVAGL